MAKPMIPRSRNAVPEQREIEVPVEPDDSVPSTSPAEAVTFMLPLEPQNNEDDIVFALSKQQEKPQES